MDGTSVLIEPVLNAKQLCPLVFDEPWHRKYGNSLFFSVVFLFVSLLAHRFVTIVATWTKSKSLETTMAMSGWRQTDAGPREESWL
jgi:hypothetical protein